MAAEGRETGTVKWSVYLSYGSSIGTILSFLLLIAMVAGQGAYVATDWWLASWSRALAGKPRQI